MKLGICCLTLLAAWAGPLRAETYPEVEKLVRDYFAASEAQQWKTVVAMYQPDSLEVIRTAIMSDAQIPKTAAEVNDGNREMVSLMLQSLAVKTPEEAWALPASAFYERMLEEGQKRGVTAGMRDVKTTIKGIKVEKDGAYCYADAEVDSILSSTLYSCTTHFVFKPLDGKLKIVAMTKTKLEPRELKGGGKPTPAAPGAKPE